MHHVILERWSRTQSVIHNRDARIGYGLIEDAERYPDYPKVTQRALVFQGRQDPIVPVEYAREFTPPQRMVWTGGMPLWLFTGVRKYTLTPTDSVTHPALLSSTRCSRPGSPASKYSCRCCRRRRIPP